MAWSRADVSDSHSHHHSQTGTPGVASAAPPGPRGARLRRPHRRVRRVRVGRRRRRAPERGRDHARARLAGPGRGRGRRAGHGRHAQRGRPPRVVALRPGHRDDPPRRPRGRERARASRTPSTTCSTRPRRAASPSSGRPTMSRCVRLTDDGRRGHGAIDPHFWTDPIVDARRRPRARPGARRDGRADERPPGGPRGRAWMPSTPRSARRSRSMPPERRQLVTGHESMGYFADRYGFQLIGAVIPGPLVAGRGLGAASWRTIATLIRDPGCRPSSRRSARPRRSWMPSPARPVSGSCRCPATRCPRTAPTSRFIRDIATAASRARSA